MKTQLEVYLEARELFKEKKYWKSFKRNVYLYFYPLLIAKNFIKNLFTKKD